MVLGYKICSNALASYQCALEGALGTKGTGTGLHPGLGSQALRQERRRDVPGVGRALSNFSLENMQDWPPARDLSQRSVESQAAPPL